MIANDHLPCLAPELFDKLRTALVEGLSSHKSRMIIGVGIDVCDVDRFAESIERRPGLVRRIFTTAEAERPMASKAARFAAKEALAKALGAPDGLSWLDAEVLTDDQGKPSFKITGTVAARAAELGICTIHLSMSHDAGIASAVVICEA